ncbi:MAG: hypothetical protein SX243_24895, partial [Acidobacteriota bacterium]|nr:hypothetical protein [Acidobacteriota bacterium]
MPFVLLQTPSGQYLSVTSKIDLPEAESPFERGQSTEVSVHLTVEATAEPTAWLVEERGENQVVLREAGVGHYLTAVDGGGSGLTVEGEEGKFQIFTRAPRGEDGERWALMAPDGQHYLSETKDGELGAGTTKLDSAAEFLITDVSPLSDPAEGGGHSHVCCCGPVPATLEPPSEPEHPQEGEHDSGGPGGLWDDESHQGLLHRGIALISGFDTPDVRQFLEIWRSFPASDSRRPGAPKSDKFKFAGGQVFQGLYEADYVERYIDRWNPLDWPHPYSYRTHFYDSKKRTNYLSKNTAAIAAIRAGLLARGKDRHTLNHMTALTEGQRYFNQAVHFGRRLVRFGRGRKPEDLRQAGYYLGLCLHFLTDLTQSMHADNYTAVDLWPERGWGLDFHGTFESFMDARPEGRPWDESVA